MLTKNDKPWVCVASKNPDHYAVTYPELPYKQIGTKNVDTPYGVIEMPVYRSTDEGLPRMNLMKKSERLINCAPALLRALEAVLPYTDRVDQSYLEDIEVEWFRRDIEEAKAVIKLAKGEE